MRRLRLAPLAVNDLDEITAFIRESSEQNADAFERCSLGTFEELMAEDLGVRRAFPDHSTAEGLCLRYVAGHPNHVIFFEVDAEEVLILRVLHAARGDLRDQAVRGTG